MSILLRLVRVAVPVCIFAFIFLSLPFACGHGHDHGHGHSHDHGHSHGNEEAPAYKYSKQANAEPDHTHDTHHSGHEQAEHSTAESSRSNLWFEAITATVLISIAPYLILFFVPVTNSAEHRPYLKVLLAFASGGLLGDAFLHLIPHALMAQQAKGSHSHSHSHSHDGGEGGHSHDMTIGVSVLAGIITFLIVEKLVRIFKGGHSHSHSAPAKTESKKDDGGKKKSGKEVEKITPAEGDIKVAGYLNLAADFTHNLTDGLAIGASFLAGQRVGIVTTVTIFLHEIPHEIGDFAILLQSGCTKRKAMLLQLVTAVGAMAGTCIALLAEGADAESIAWILPFTGGGFIYIATVSVIPELLEQTSFWQSVWEIMALLCGVGLMMGIALLEEAGHA